MVVLLSSALCCCGDKEDEDGDEEEEEEDGVAGGLLRRVVAFGVVVLMLDGNVVMASVIFVPNDDYGNPVVGGASFQAIALSVFELSKVKERRARVGGDVVHSPIRLVQLVLIGGNEKEQKRRKARNFVCLVG